MFVFFCLSIVPSTNIGTLGKYEFGEHLTRDQRLFFHTESLQITQIPKSVLILFSSAHSFSGFRSENCMVMAEASFCAQIKHFSLSHPKP